jgi:hypothetical protein
MSQALLVEIYTKHPKVLLLKIRQHISALTLVKKSANT